MPIISERAYAEQSVSTTISAFYRSMKLGAVKGSLLITVPLSKSTFSRKLLPTPASVNLAQEIVKMFPVIDGLISGFVLLDPSAFHVSLNL